MYIKSNSAHGQKKKSAAFKIVLSKRHIEVFSIAVLILATSRCVFDHTHIISFAVVGGFMQPARTVSQSKGA